MVAPLERRCVLLLAAEPERQALRSLLSGPVPGWEVVEADGFERARFLLQMEPCDVVLVDAGASPAGEGGIGWLTAQSEVPVVFLTTLAAEVVLEALGHRDVHWLPRDFALANPAVLGAVLWQAAQAGEARRQLRRANESLLECRRQVSRLVGLLWEVSPAEGRPHWFNQRHMLERLEEELARSRRHGGPLTVVLGDVRPPHEERLSGEDEQRLAQWTADQVTHAKRRCDVAGQYGQNGFMLLLPRTTDQAAVGCCRRLQTILERAPGPLPSIHACFGVAGFSPATATLHSLMGRAEERLERARGTEGRVEF
jgi:diguanylate cyclase (GGDEF)-like protein